MRVLMITTSHKWDDSRIFWLESCNLKKLGIKVTVLAINSYCEHSEICGVKVITFGRRRNRLGRFLLNPIEAIRYCKRNASDYDILHMHDPEMIPWVGLLRRITNKPVIYDMHEFLPDIMSVRSWVPSCLRQYFIVLADIIECRAVNIANAVVVVNELGKKRACQLGARESTIFMGVPSKTEAKHASSYNSSRTGIVYVGGISKVRGADIIAEVAQRLFKSYGCSVTLAGPLGDETAKTTAALEAIDYRGIVDRPEIWRILNESAIGWLPLRRTPNHDKAWALKLGEYMAAGLPVVSSDLKYCSSVINRYDCGIVVSADDVEAHLDALDYLLINQDEAKRMGNNGKRAVLEGFNAEAYALKLHDLYERLLN